MSTWDPYGNYSTGTSTSIYVDNTTTTWYPPANQVYVYGGSPSVETPPSVVPAPRSETPEQWLRRRVEEVCWKPA